MTDQPDLTSYRWIVVNTSAGKDSAVTLDVVCTLAEQLGVLDRVVALHCDLGKDGIAPNEQVEWEGVAELAERQAAIYGVRFIIVRGTDAPGKKNGKDLLDYIEAHGKWPDRKNRFCTSDWKRTPAQTVWTRLANEVIGHPTRRPESPVRILNVMGMRAQESPERAKMADFGVALSNSRKHVDDWLAIHHWSTDEVWAHIEREGLEMHPAYAAGMGRLSCALCIFATKPALQLAIRMSPPRARRYADAERRMGHTFKNGFSIADLVDETLASDGPIDDGPMDWAA